MLIGGRGVATVGYEEGMGSDPVGIGPLRNNGAVRSALTGFSMISRCSLYKK